MIGIPGQTELAIEIENRYQLGPQIALAPEQTSSRLPERIGGLEQDRNSHYVNYDYNTQEQYIAPEPVSGTHPVGGTATFDATSETTGVTLPQPKQYSEFLSPSTTTLTNLNYPLQRRGSQKKLQIRMRYL